MAVTYRSQIIAQDVAENGLQVGTRLKCLPDELLLLAFREIAKDKSFPKVKFPISLEMVKRSIHNSPERTKSAMK